MKKDLLHTPEGVRDIYGAECMFKSRATQLLKDVCERYGYSHQIPHGVASCGADYGYS